MSAATVATIRTKRGRVRTLEDVRKDERRSRRLVEALCALGITDRKRQIAKLAETPRVSKRLAAIWLAGGSMGEVGLDVLQDMAERIGVHWLWVIEHGNARTAEEWLEDCALLHASVGLFSAERAESDAVYLSVALTAVKGDYPARAQAMAFIVMEHQNPLLAGGLLKRYSAGKVTIDQMCAPALAWWRTAQRQKAGTVD